MLSVGRSGSAAIQGEGDGETWKFTSPLPDDGLLVQLQLPDINFYLPWGNNSIFRLSGTIVGLAEGYTFEGDPVNPLCLGLIDGIGLVYLESAQKLYIIDNIIEND